MRSRKALVQRLRRMVNSAWPLDGRVYNSWPCAFRCITTSYYVLATSHQFAIECKGNEHESNTNIDIWSGAARCWPVSSHHFELPRVPPTTAHSRILYDRSPALALPGYARINRRVNGLCVQFAHKSNNNGQCEDFFHEK